MSVNESMRETVAWISPCEDQRRGRMFGSKAMTVPALRTSASTWNSDLPSAGRENGEGNPRQVDQAGPAQGRGEGGRIVGEPSRCRGVRQ